MHVIEFLQSPLAEDTGWYVDPATSAIVCVCALCGAEGRQETPEQMEFTFEHHALCPVGLAATAAERRPFAPGAIREEEPEDANTASDALLVRRALWSELMSACEGMLDVGADNVNVALQLLRDGGGASLPEKLRNALDNYLSEFLDTREQERRSLEAMTTLPAEAAVRSEPPAAGADGDVPVIAPKALWDQLKGLLSATIDSSGAMAALLLRLVEVLEAGEVPDAAFLEELRAHVADTIEACDEDRKLVERVMGALHWAPVL